MYIMINMLHFSSLVHVPWIHGLHWSFGSHMTSKHSSYNHHPLKDKSFLICIFYFLWRSVRKSIKNVWQQNYFLHGCPSKITDWLNLYAATFQYFWIGDSVPLISLVSKIQANATGTTIWTSDIIQVSIKMY